MENITKVEATKFITRAEMGLHFFFVFACLFCVCCGDLTMSGPGFVLSCTGNCVNVNTQTVPGMILMGGGTDVDDAFVWLVQRAGGGNILVLR